MQPAELAEFYLQNGIQPLPLPHKSKRPVLPDWPNLRIHIDEIGKFFNGSLLNIGGLLGTSSGGIISVDLDWPEAAKLAQHLLPASWSFGRSGQLRHVLIRAPGAQTKQFDGPVSIAQGEQRRIVEILADGKQAMLPGSMHPNGQLVEWLNHPDQTTLIELPPEQLLSRVSALAGAALLVKLWPDLEGSRHDVSLALAGTLHHAGWPSKRIERLLSALLAGAHDPERIDRARAALDTLRSARDGKAVTGLPRLAERLPPEIIDCLTRWWQLGSTGPALTFGGQTSPIGRQTDGIYE